MIVTQKIMKRLCNGLKFLNNESFTTFSGHSFAKALLFPMEKVFESYIGFHLKKLLSDSAWHVQLQDKGYHLFQGNLHYDQIL